LTFLQETSAHTIMLTDAVSAWLCAKGSCGDISVTHYLLQLFMTMRWYTERKSCPDTDDHKSRSPVMLFKYFCAIHWMSATVGRKVQINVNRIRQNQIIVQCYEWADYNYSEWMQQPFCDLIECIQTQKCNFESRLFSLSIKRLNREQG